MTYCWQGVYLLFVSWVSQANGHNDRRHGAVLHSLATAAARPRRFHRW